MTAEKIEICPLKEDILRVTVEGISPLVVNKNHYTVAEMDMQSKGKKNQAKPERNPQKEYEGSIHWIDQEKDISGFPTRGFKSACASMGPILDSKAYKAQRVKAAFFIVGDLTPIEGPKKMRHDVVRLLGRTPTDRFRVEYWPWKTTLEIIFAESIMGVSQILHLLNEAGSRIGVGENRPQKGGAWGRFKVVSAERYSTG